MINSIKVLEGKVLIKVTDVETVTESGLHLPHAKEASETTTGTVIAVGRSILHESGKIIPSEVAVGDKVLYSKFGGSDVVLNDTAAFKIMKETDIFMVIGKVGSTK